jgi:hypothetical protein
MGCAKRPFAQRRREHPGWVVWSRDGATVGCDRAPRASPPGRDVAEGVGLSGYPGGIRPARCSAGAAPGQLGRLSVALVERHPLQPLIFDDIEQIDAEHERAVHKEPQRRIGDLAALQASIVDERNPVSAAISS